MKLSTTVTFRNTLFAPVGRKFCTSCSKQINELIGDEKWSISLGGRTLTWEEIHIGISKDLPKEFWDEHINNITVKE